MLVFPGWVVSCHSLNPLQQPNFSLEDLTGPGRWEQLSVDIYKQEEINSSVINNRFTCFTPSWTYHGAAVEEHLWEESVTWSEPSCRAADPLSSARVFAEQCRAGRNLSHFAHAGRVSFTVQWCL